MLRILCLLICVTAGPAFAQQSSELYHTQVQLTDVEDAESVAKKEGLTNVLVKVSGQQDITTNDVIKKALSQSSRYVTQMSFIENTNALSSMKLGYNSSMVLNLLTQAEQSIWESPRKSVLVWVVNDHNYQRDIIWEQSENTYIDRIKDAASERGLPVLFPVGDFDDVTSIEITDLWGNFKKPIAEASQRYNPQAILVVKIQGNSSKWTLFDTTPDDLSVMSKKPIEGRESGAVQLADMVNSVSDYFARTYAKQLGAVVSQSERISIRGLHTTREFFTLEKQLKQLNSVASVQVDTIKGDNVTYTISLLGDYQQFNDELLSKNNRISLIPEVVEEPLVNAGMVTPQQQEPLDGSEVIVDENAPIMIENELPTNVEEFTSEENEVTKVHAYQYQA